MGLWKFWAIKDITEINESQDSKDLYKDSKVHNLKISAYWTQRVTRKLANYENKGYGLEQ
jgi:hypothetical protein